MWRHWDECKWWHDCIYPWCDFGCENTVVQAVSGDMAACVKCRESFCVFVLWSSCDNCRWSAKLTVSQYYIFICNIILIIINDLLVWDVLNYIHHLHIKTNGSFGFLTVLTCQISVMCVHRNTHHVTVTTNTGRNTSY